jgi:hypothetical protein
MRARTWTLSLALAALVACAPPDDDPSQVKDLRVLGVSTEPAEVMRASCQPTPVSLAAFATPLQVTALIVDPKGQGRAVDYAYFACASLDDVDCKNEAMRIPLAQGTTTAGELAATLAPGTATVPSTGQRLIDALVEEDVYKGFGGIRVPLVLKLKAGSEEVYARKLLVYNCPSVAGVAQNLNPVLPGITVDGQVMPPSGVPVLSGPGPFELRPEDFSAREEAYVVPSFDLEPVALKESWKLGWHTDLGKIAPTQSGGVERFSQSEERHRVEWTPPSRAGEQDVTFWVVTRDGRGGLTWLARRARYRP